MSPVTRLVNPDDAPVLVAQLAGHNRDFLAPSEPLRDDGYFTDAAQLAGIRDALSHHEHGTTLPHVILDPSDRVVGRITLNGIVRGPSQSCS